MKIQASAIILQRLEGTVDECVTVLVRADGAYELSGKAIGRYVDTDDIWRRADAVLAAWSHTAPKDGSYNKCAFEIRYADGETYSGRYDLENMTVAGYPSLEGHVRSHLEHVSGRKRPAHATGEQWEIYLSNVVGDVKRAQYERFLEGYAIGSEASA